jgi:hypothetical protein
MMVTQQEVLEFIADQTRRGRSISFKDLVPEFGLSPEAGCDHLKRLWRDRLIEAVTFRPSRFHYRLQPGESLRKLRFRLAPRGEARLRWYREKEKEVRWPFY